MKTLAIGPLHNEGVQVVEIVKKFPRGLVDEILIVNDASTDGAIRHLEGTGVTLLNMPKRSGPGTAIRAGIDYGLKKGYDLFTVFATNGKDNPAELAPLIALVKGDRADFVQGSRFLRGGGWGHTPFHRIWGMRAFSLLFSLMVGRWITDGTNGFRAMHRRLFEDPRINLHQEWLEGYPLETYLFVQAVRLGYRVAEVPVNKVYPASKKNYSKMRPWIDWWNYFKPVPLLVLRLKK